MAKRKSDAGKAVFNILGFQYKPLEKKLIAGLLAEGHPEAVAQYKKMSYTRKIYILDGLAKQMGL